jgi:hypothetical protein
MPLSIASLTYRDIAKTIDHSLLRPELDDAFVGAGCRLALAYDVASVCVRPLDVVRAGAILAGSEVALGTVIGFPHGGHLTATKVDEATRNEDDPRRLPGAPSREPVRRGEVRGDGRQLLMEAAALTCVEQSPPDEQDPIAEGRLPSAAQWHRS